MGAPKGYKIETNRIIHGFELLGWEFRNFVSSPKTQVGQPAPNLMMFNGGNGIGKSEKLRQLVRKYNKDRRKKKLQIGYESPDGTNIGYFLWMHRNPDDLLVLDDIDLLFRTKATGELVSKGTDSGSRWIPSHKTTKGPLLDPDEGPPAFEFLGRIIIISNPNPRGTRHITPQAQATLLKLNSRCAHYVHINGDDDETFHYAGYVVCVQNPEYFTKFPRQVISDVLFFWAHNKDNIIEPTTRSLAQLLHKRHAERNFQDFVRVTSSFLKGPPTVRPDYMDYLWTYDPPVRHPRRARTAPAPESAQSDNVIPLASKQAP